MKIFDYFKVTFGTYLVLMPAYQRILLFFFFYFVCLQAYSFSVADCMLGRQPAMSSDISGLAKILGSIHEDTSCIRASLAALADTKNVARSVDIPLPVIAEVKPFLSSSVENMQSPLIEMPTIAEAKSGLSQQSLALKKSILSYVETDIEPLHKQIREQASVISEQKTLIDSQAKSLLDKEEAFVKLQYDYALLNYGKRTWGNPYAPHPLTFEQWLKNGKPSF